MSRIIPCPNCSQLNRVSDEKDAKQGRCANCKSSLFQGHPINLTRTNFDRQIKSEDLPVVVDFWAAWCGPCRAMAPVFEAAAAEFEPRLRFGKVDTEAEQEIAARYRIQAIPTLVLFKGGKEINRRSGALSGADLRRWIDQLLPVHH
jgi:thioredoxin 2